MTTYECCVTCFNNAYINIYNIRTFIIYIYSIPDYVLSLLNLPILPLHVWLDSSLCLSWTDEPVKNTFTKYFSRYKEYRFDKSQKYVQNIIISDQFCKEIITNMIFCKGESLYFFTEHAGSPASILVAKANIFCSSRVMVKYFVRYYGNFSRHLDVSGKRRHIGETIKLSVHYLNSFLM